MPVFVGMRMLSGVWSVLALLVWIISDVFFISRCVASEARTSRGEVSVRSQIGQWYVDHRPLFPFPMTCREMVLDKSFQQTLAVINACVTQASMERSVQASSVSDSLTDFTSSTSFAFPSPPICFISYVCQDPDMGWSSLIEAYLRQAGVQTIFDRRDLRTGDAIERFIKESVHQATFAIVLFSPQYLTNYDRQTYIYDEAEAIRIKWEQSVDFVIPVLVAGEADASIPPSCLGVDSKGRLKVLYVPMTNATHGTTYEACLEGIHRMLSERIFHSIIGVGAPYEHVFHTVRQRFTDHCQRLPRSAMQTELKAARRSFPQSLKPHKAFIDRTNADGQRYVDLLFDALFMDEDSMTSMMGKRPFSEITVCAVSGMGGVGKTTLATEYVHTYKSFYQFIYWMDGSSRRDFQLSCLALIETLGLRAPEQQEGEGDEAYGEVLIDVIKEYLPQRKSNWLLVVDNVDEPALTTSLKPEGGHILYTSRSKEWLKTPIVLDVFRESESIAYLLQMTGFDDTHHDAAKALAIELDHLPLALAQAAAYIRRQQTETRLYTFMDYVREYQKRYAYLLEQQQIQPSINRREAIVMTTWDTTMHKLSEEARHLMGCFAYMAPDGIPLQVFSETVTPEGVIADLITYSMIHYDQTSHLLSLHRLVQCATREKYERLLSVEPIINALIDRWALWITNQSAGISSQMSDTSSFEQDAFTHHGQRHLNTLQQHIETLVHRKKLNDAKAIDLWIYTRMLDYNFVNSSLKSTTQTLDGSTQPSLVDEILSEIAIKKRDQILASVQTIFGGFLPDDNHMVGIINTFNSYSPEGLNDFCGHIHACIRGDMNMEERRKIVMMLDEIKIERRHDFIEHTRFVYENDMGAEMLYTYLWTFADSEHYFKPNGAFDFDEGVSASDEEEDDVDETQIDDDEDAVPSYYAYLDQLIHLKLPEELFENAMAFVPRLSVEESQFITHVVDDLFQIDEDGRYHVIQCLATLNQTDAHLFVEKAYGLLTPDMDAALRYIFIMKFAELEEPVLILSGIEKITALRQPDGKVPAINSLIARFGNNYLAVLVYQALSVFATER